MRIGLVVDSACDLPPSFIREHNIVILPISIRINDKVFVDERDPDATLAFYRNHMSNAGDAETAPFSVEQIKAVFLEQLVIDYDYVFCLTIASSRSPIYENAQSAAFSILSEYKPIRAKAGVAGPFALRVVDTQNLFSAQALLAVEVAKMISAGALPNQIRARIDQIVPQLYAYMLPKSLYQLRARARKKGDKSVGWLKYAMGTTLDMKPVLRGLRNETGPVMTLRHFNDGAYRCFQFLIRLIHEQKLLTPCICLGYSGDLRELEELPGHAELCSVASEAGVTIYTSIMSITGGINVGEGALAFAMAAEDHEFT